MALAAGAVFAGYTIVRQLGSGGMGEVYLGQHPRLPRFDALKVLRSEIGNNIDFRRRFIREADSAAKLSHPNIVTVYDRGETDGKLWITTQYVEGTDAARLPYRSFPTELVTTMTAQIVTAVGDALDYAHRNKLIHRDVKPHNILLRAEQGRRPGVFLADFGIARPLAEHGELTVTDWIAGTFAYAAPEQLLGQDLDGRADQFALAATAFDLLTGEPPFKGSNQMAMISKRLTQQEPPQLAAIRPDLDDLDPVLSKAMAYEREDRYPDCAAFARDFARAATAVLARQQGTTLHRPTAESAPSPPVTATRAAPHHDSARRIADGYRFSGKAIELGSVRVAGYVDPSAKVRIPLAMVTRHGFVAGAPGTGKTKTLQLIAEQLSAAGVPVVMTDFKGDLSGLARPGQADYNAAERAKDTGDDWVGSDFPVEFLSLGTGGIGVPVRATVSAFGPILLSEVLGLNRTQESTLGLIFHWADQQGLALLDLKDLRSVIAHLTSDDGKAQLKAIGGVSAQTAGVILRSLIKLEADGGGTFFGEPEIDPADFLRVDARGRGIISLFEAGQLVHCSVMFATLLWWALADMCTYMPEVGDVDKPKVVFVFDEAHLLFKDSSPRFLDLVEQTVKQLRSKGIGIVFSTQLATDIPNAVLSQLCARIQHALRPFTPADQQALAETVRSYPKTEFYNLATDLTALGTGEAMVTVLSERGAPTPVAWTRLRSPRSLMGTVGPDHIKAAAQVSPLSLKYGMTIDRESAYEQLHAMGPAAESMDLPPIYQAGLDLPPLPQPAEKANSEVLEQMMDNPAFKAAMRNAGTVIGREITRSIFGTGRRRPPQG